MFRQRISQRKRAWSRQRARRLRVRTANRDETGASLVEYALLLALIAVVAIGALTFLGHTVSNTLNNVGNDIAAGAAGGGGGTTTTTTTSTTTTTIANVAPAFTSLPNVGFTDQAASTTFTATASGTPAPTITCSDCSGGGNNLPNGVTFNAGTFTASAGSATKGDCQGNPYKVHLTANNGVGTPATQTVTITMAVANNNFGCFSQN